MIGIRVDHIIDGVIELIAEIRAARRNPHSATNRMRARLKAEKSQKEAQ